jgi:nicotinamidase-related amidase
MKTALLLIDLQNDYFPGGKMELEGSLQAVFQAQKILTLFREEKRPVVHVQHLSLRPGATFFLPGTDGAEIQAQVRPLPDETVIQKSFPNSFRNTALLEHLRKEEIGHLVITGMMTHMCVEATVRAAFDLGFQCTVVQDACATRSLSFGEIIVPAVQVQAAFLAALGSVYAKIVSVGGFILEKGDPSRS